MRTDKISKEIRRSALKTSKKGLRKQSQKMRDIILPERKAELDKQWKFFYEIWSERPHRSEVSGRPIFGEPLSIYFHHIFPKTKFPDMKFDKDNIIILTFEEHQQVEANPFIFEELNKKRESLHIKRQIKLM